MGLRTTNELAMRFPINGEDTFSIEAGITRQDTSGVEYGLVTFGVDSGFRQPRDDKPP